MMMIDVSKKPTAADIERKARMLHYLAKTNAALAAGDQRENELDAIASNAELIQELSHELWIMAEVHDDFAAFTDFPELQPTES